MSEEISRRRSILWATPLACGLAASWAGARATPQFAVLYNFQGDLNEANDAAVPEAGVLLGPGGVLYGTTASGGDVVKANCTGGNGCGTVYELMPIGGGVWKDTVIYSFTGLGDGTNPTSDLARDASTGALYGTAGGGGPNQQGVAFMLTPPTSGTSWPFAVVYGFGATRSDGEQPSEGLLAGPAGSFYGTTFAGGTAGPHHTQTGDGTVFQLLPPPGMGDPWSQAVLVAFPTHGGSANGEHPSYGALLGGPGGSLLVATEGGGPHDRGVIYDLVPPAEQGGAWTEIVAASFATSKLGSDPNAGLVVDAAGNYYGTTAYGGSHNNGVVFQLAPPAGGSTNWTYNVIHIFRGGADGANPEAGLIVGSGGILYGTTYGGGATEGCPGGCGAVFQVTRPAPGASTWKEKVLHGFANADGALPYARLAIDSNGVLYGTTLAGGSASRGVVFSVQP